MSPDRGLKPDRHTQDTAEMALALARTALDAAGSGGGGGEPAPPPPPPIVAIPDGATFAVTSEHDGAILWVDQAQALELQLPEIIENDTQVTLLGTAEAGVLFGGAGATTMVPSGARVLGGAGRICTAFLLYRGGAWHALTPEPPDTVSVVFDEGWPASRPDALHVRAIGGDSPPAWLTTVDVWEQPVEEEGPV